MPTEVKSWQVPAAESEGYLIKGWLDELVSNGDRWLQSQRGIQNVNEDIRLLMGFDQENQLQTNMLQSDIRTYVETIADLRQIATLGTKAPQLKQNVAAYNGAMKYIFWDSEYVFNIRKALQWAMLGRGYIWTKFSRDKYGWGKGRFVFDPLGPLEVLPEQLPANNRVKGSYAVTIVRPMPIAEAHARFPQFQQYLTPISRYDWHKYSTNGAMRLDFWDRWKFNEDRSWDNRYCVPLDSEILTRSGWKKYDEISKGDEVMGYNKDTQKCEWTPLLDITVKRDQEVYEYGSKKFKVRCTKDHKWVIKKRASRKERREKNIFYNDQVELASIDNCGTASILIQAAAAPDGPGIKSMDSDGYMVRANAVEMVLQMTSGERRAFITGMLYGEGCVHPPKNKTKRPTTIFAQRPGPVYDAMKLACALEGIATNEGYYCNRSASDTKVFTLRHKPHKNIKEMSRKLHSIEDVWCPTTTLGTWVMRQGDLITITGNCEIRYHFIRDLRMNETGRSLQMGVPGSTWGYEVPSYGDLIVGTNPLNGLPESRTADENDCRVYPQLRLVITCPTVPVPMYDDTAFDWHGEMPIAQLDVNDWAWAGMGYSAIRNVAGLERARRARLSEIDEVLAVRKDPPTGYDISAGVGRTQIEKLDLLRAQGVRVGTKGDPKKAVVSVLPESIAVDAVDFQAQEVIYSANIAKTLGLTDIASLRDLKMNVSDQSFDKMIENLGPMAKGIALNIWQASGDIAQMLKYGIPQYISVDELINMTGPDGVAIQTYDNDPNTLIPSHLPGESLDSPSRFAQRDRAKWCADALNVVSTPSQQLNITQMQEKMLYMFFLQQKLPISMETTMEKLGVQGYDVEYEKWKAEQLEQGEWKLDVQSILQGKAETLGLMPTEPAPGQGAGGGRPPTAQKPPHAELKGSQSGKVRVVNSQS